MNELQIPQSIKRGARVRIKTTDSLVAEPGQEAIVWASYSQQQLHGDPNSYTLILLDKESGEPIDRIAWFSADELQVISNDYMAGHDLMDRYFSAHSSAG